MAEGLHLIGYGPSVYTRIVRVALIEMGLQAGYTEADPFAEVPDPVLVAHSPFIRVPVVRHGDFTLSETVAILHYLDRLSAKPSLIPQDAKAAAQMAQVIGIVDAYGYWPLVRDVFVHGFLNAIIGEEVVPERLRSGLGKSQVVLQALEAIAQDGRVLNGKGLSLADIHLAPMMDYFIRAEEGAQMLSTYPMLSAWWQNTAQRPSMVQTDPLFTD